MEFFSLFLEVLSEITKFLMHEELLIQENQSVIRNSRVKLCLGNLGVFQVFVRMGIFWFIWSIIYMMTLLLNHSCSPSSPPSFQTDWDREHVHFCNFNWIVELSSYTCFYRTNKAALPGEMGQKLRCYLSVTNGLCTTIFVPGEVTLCPDSISLVLY